MTQFPKRLFHCALFSLIVASHVLHGRAANVAPALPAPTGTVVNVSTEAQLQTAVRHLASNTTIILAPGTYRLTHTLAVNGTLANVAIRGRTDNRDDVVLQGPGMANARDGNVPSGIWTGGHVQGVTIANLTIRDVFHDAIVFNAGTQRPHVYNVHLIDAGAAFVKSHPDGLGGGVNDGIVEYSVIEYTTTAKDDGGAGIDVQTGANWIVRHNLFHNIVAPAGYQAGPAVLAWHASTNTVTEGNTFLNCARAIAYGLEDTRGGFDHRGGIIRNNFVYRSSAQPGDVGIGVADSPNTQILNNTVFLSGTYATPIEYRFAGTTGVWLANNLLDGFLWARDGATGTEQNNLGGATVDMFADAAAGDLHLAASATAAIDQGVALANVTDDWDGQSRPSGAAPDIGADEFVASDAVTPTAPKTATGASSVNGASRLPSASVGPVMAAAQATVSIWSASATPSRIEITDTNAVELGLRFHADTSGTVTGVRFYKGVTNLGTHIGNLWTNSGTLLATATFVNETLSGWQQVMFSSAVAISANTTYIVSYHTTLGQYGVDDAYFATTGVDNAPLHALADGVAGANGVYTYGQSAFPTQTYYSSNYWVDVLFIADVADTTAPTVSITAPVNGVTVSGSAVTVSATATDNVGVAGVQFKLDGANLGAEDTAGPYTQTWNSTTATNGSHTLTAVARDAAGNTTTSPPVTVTVSNADTTAPTVSITAPATGATVSGSAVTVSAIATDNVGVAGVQFKLDGANLGAEDTAGPYTQAWNTTTATNGSHTLTAVARDAAGNTTTSPPVTVTVSNADTTAPTVSITAPVSGATVSGSAVTVSATATDNVGVAGVQFKLDGVNLGAEATATPYARAWDTTTATNGSHTLSALARDAAGNQTTSSGVTVTVSNVSPPSGYTHEPAGFTVWATTPMNAFTGNGWDIVNSNGYATVVADATAPLSPPNVGQWQYPAGFAGGSAPATMYRALPPAFNEGFVGAMWKPSNPWQGHSTYVNKIFFLLGGACGNLIPVMYGPPGGPYQLRVAPEWGNWSWLTPNVNDIPIALGSWHKIELYFKYNTPGTGIVRWWMDGTLIGDYSSVSFPASGCLVEFQFSPTWGGVGDVKTETDYFWFDDPYISIPSGTAPTGGTILFQEDFDDANVAGPQRG